MRANKLKQFACVLTSSLILAACNNNVGGTANTNAVTVKSVASQTTTQSVVVKAAPDASTSPMNYISKSIVDSFAGNFFAFPGNFGFNLLSGWLGGLIFQDDTQQQILDGLKDIQDKLAEMDKKLDKSLNLENDILNLVKNFYNAQMKANFEEVLKEPDATAREVQEQYHLYTQQNIFGASSSNISAKDLDALFDYAASQKARKDDVEEVIGKNNSSILFSRFKAEYIDVNSGGASFFNLLRSRKEMYVAALFNGVPENNFMAKIDYYNQQNMHYQSELAGAYQKLYNIQLAQLAYMYALGINVDLNSLPQLDSKWQGKAGFKEAVKLLNQYYNGEYTQLGENLKAGFAPISNQDLYTRVNNMFATELLDNNTFNTSKPALGQCVVSDMVFDKLDNEHGILRLGAKCIVKENPDKTKTFSSVHQDVPYKFNGSSIHGTTYDHLRFDVNYPKMLVFSNRNKDSFGTDDVKVLTTNNEISDAWSWRDVSNVNRMADSWTDTYQNWISKFYWSAAQVDLADDVSVFSERYLAGYDNLGDDAKRILPGWNYGLSTSGYSSLLQYPGFYGSNKDDSPKGWYAQWHLLSYNGKQALLKVEFLNSSTERQWIGIGCMNTFGDQSCHRDTQDKNTLVWEDGTRLTLTGKMEPIPSISRDNNWKKLSGNWSITGSAPENFEVLPKKD